MSTRKISNESPRFTIPYLKQKVRNHVKSIRFTSGLAKKKKANLDAQIITSAQHEILPKSYTSNQISMDASTTILNRHRLRCHAVASTCLTNQSRTRNVIVEWERKRNTAGGCDSLMIQRSRPAL